MQLSIVIPVFNEESNILILSSELFSVLASLELSYEILFVDDGSTDQTPVILEKLHREHPCVRVVNSTVNQGQEKSLINGILNSTGDFIICMDGDLQHPTSCIPIMIEKARLGFDSVSMIRKSSLLKNGIWHILSLIFYFLLRLIKRRRTRAFSSDYFLITKELSIKIKLNTIFLRGFIQEIAARPAYISYQPNERQYGKSKYSFLSKIKQAYEIFTSRES